MPDGRLWGRSSRSTVTRAVADSAATARAFLDLCGTADTSACAFSTGSPSATRAKYTELLQRLRAHPVSAGGQTYTYDLTVGLVGEILYAVEPTPGGLPGWASLGTFLQQLWMAGAQGTAPRSAHCRPIRPPRSRPLAYLRRRQHVSDRWIGWRWSRARACARERLRPAHESPCWRASATWRKAQER